jgi:outer membrane protein
MPRFTRVLKSSLFATGLIALTAATGQAWAQKAGDVVLGAGILHYAPQDKSSTLRFTSPVDRELPGSGSNLKSATTLGLNVHYFVTDNWAVEGVLGIPPRLKLDGAGSLSGLGELATVRLWGPSVLGKYVFGAPTDKVRFSAGVGVTYAAFRSVRLNSGIQNALGGALGIAPGGSITSAKVDNKFGPVFNVGVNYAFNETTGLTFSVSYIPMKTKATLTTSVSGRTVAQSQAKLTLDPIVPFLYLTHRF